MPAPAENRTVEVLPAAIRLPLGLYTYQRAYIEDESPLEIIAKSRRIGYSFAAGLKLVIFCLREKVTCIVLSRSDRLLRFV
jgi:phage FluMu gp28-like protein